MVEDARAPEDPAFIAYLLDAQSGNREALGELLRSFQDGLQQRARRSLPRDLRRKDSGSDLLQDTMMEAQEQLNQFHGKTRAELEAWLIEILHHRLLMSVRKFRNTLKRQLSKEVYLANADVRQDVKDELVSREPSPPDEAIAHEEEGRHRSLFAQLSPEERQILHWHRNDGLTFAEIGIRLGISEEAAKKRHRQALKHLGELVQEDRRQHGES